MRKIVSLILVIYIAFPNTPAIANDEEKLIACVDAHQKYISQLGISYSTYRLFLGTNPSTKLNYDAYRNLINCPEPYFISKVSNGKITERNCFLRIFNNTDDKCKKYNRALSILTYAIESNELYLEEQLIKYNSTRVFKNSKCSVDCSGHKAGYIWAKENKISTYSKCGNVSDSFEKGCIIYVEENNQ